MQFDMMHSKTYGYVAGIVASVAYGLNPFFALPQYERGMEAGSVLIYRYGFAAVMLAGMLLLRKESLRVTLRQLGCLAVMGTLFGVSSLTLFESYNYMDSGIASTLLFTYPLFVVLIMGLLFHERLSRVRILALGLALLGIGLLYQGEGGEVLSTRGIVLVLASSLSYAFYIVGVNKLGLSSMSSFKMTFYAMLFGLLTFVVAMWTRGTHLQPLNSPMLWACSLGLALFPTFISLVFIAQSIRIIGETPAAILGALEPLTALAISVLVFGGHLTVRNAVGVLMILGAVLLTTLGRRLRRMVR